MQVLLRAYNGECYVWKQAKFNGLRFVVENNPVPYERIVSVQNDNRKNYLLCPSCFEVVKRDPKKIAQHKKGHNNWKKCLTCEYFYPNCVETISRKTVMNKDGSYTHKEIHKVVPQCTSNSYWSYANIGTEDAEGKCKYCNCATTELQDIHDIFTDQPGVFDDIITVDKVIDAGYTTKSKFSASCYGYRLNGQNDIEAIVNGINIVDHFIVRVCGKKYRVFYSKKYDKLYWANDEGKYVVFNGRNAGAIAYVEIKEQISKLYN